MPISVRIKQHTAGIFRGGIGLKHPGRMLNKLPVRLLEQQHARLAAPPAQVEILQAIPVHIPAAERRTLRRRSEEHTSELQSRGHLVCRLLLEKKNPPTVHTG